MPNEGFWDGGLDSFSAFLNSEKCTEEYFLRNGPQHIANGREIQKNLQQHYAAMRSDYALCCRSRDFPAALSQRQKMAALEQRLEKISMLVDFMENRYEEVRETLPNVAVVDFRRT